MAADLQKYRRLGVMLQARFAQYESDRRLAEIKWMQNLRQYLGIYDPDIAGRIGPSQSHAYPRMTRVKCVSTVSRLMSLMFPASDRNWTVTPSPEPNLPVDVMQALLDQLTREAMQAMQSAQQGGGAMPDIDGMVTAAIQKAAADRSKALERTIEDQLLELGGNKYTDYVALCRKVLMSGVIYGAGVLSGPFVEQRSQTQWRMVDGQLTQDQRQIYRPRFEFVSLWDYYPDMTAKTWDQMDGQFQRHVMSRKQVAQLAQRPDFNAEAIQEYLRNHTAGNYRRRTYESELKSLGVQNNVNDEGGRKYEVVKWEGYLYGSDINGVLEGTDDVKANDTVPVTVWLIDDAVIKADFNPWFKLTKGDAVRMYHQFVFEEDDTSLVGNGLPNIMRDSQMGACLAARMMIDNASVVAGPQVEVDLAQLRPDQDLTSIHAFKIWYRDEDAQDTMRPAIKELQFNSHLNELSQVLQTFMSFADMETFISPATGGDMSRGPSEPFRTATGASILKGDAALPFKDVVRNFDAFTESVIASLVLFNQKLNPDPTIKGDFQVVARGAMSLVAKEVRGIQIDSYINTIRPEESPFINWYELAKERAMVRDLPVGRVILPESQAQQVTQSQAQAAGQQADLQTKLTQAEIAKTEADAAKARAQADKNSANALGSHMKSLIEGVSNGITPTTSAQPDAGIAPPGAPVPPGATVAGDAGVNPALPPAIG